jgi:hypothetical protein
MFFIIAEYIKLAFYNRVIQVAKIAPDIEDGIEEDEYQYDFRIPEYYSTQEEVDKLV